MWYTSGQDSGVTAPLTLSKLDSLDRANDSGTDGLGGASASCSQPNSAPAPATISSASGSSATRAKGVGASDADLVGLPSRSSCNIAGVEGDNAADGAVVDPLSRSSCEESRRGVANMALQWRPSSILRRCRLRRA